MAKIEETLLYLSDSDPNPIEACNRGNGTMAFTLPVDGAVLVHAYYNTYPDDAALCFALAAWLEPRIEALMCQRGPGDMNQALHRLRLAVSYLYAEGARCVLNRSP